MNLPTPA